jgi:hypothetical protein
MCGTIDPGHTYNEYLGLLAKSGMTVLPYSNQRRHNPPSIPQTPLQTLIIPCTNFDPIYQVILLEISNEWNLSPAKEGS